MAGDLPEALAEYDLRHDLELATFAGAEAQVAALADDIAYNNHDLLDGLRAGLFAVGDIEDLPIVGAAFAQVDRAWPGLEPRKRRYEALRRVFGVMVEDVIRTSRDLLAGSGARSVADIRHLRRPVVRFTDAMWSDLKMIRAFLFANMYRHPKVVEVRVRSDRIVRELFTMFMGDPALLPEAWRDQVPAEEAARARMISDYIAGMTDRFAIMEHGRLCR